METILRVTDVYLARMDVFVEENLVCAEITDDGKSIVLFFDEGMVDELIEMLKITKERCFGNKVKEESKIDDGVNASECNDHIKVLIDPDTGVEHTVCYRKKVVASKPIAVR